MCNFPLIDTQLKLEVMTTVNPQLDPTLSNDTLVSRLNGSKTPIAISGKGYVTFMNHYLIAKLSPDGKICGLG